MSTDFRFIGIAPSVDLTERRSKMINDQTEPFTLDEMRGYKVFTALLTQSGGDNSSAIFWDDVPGGPDLTIGTTYIISDNLAGADFTNVGAPNNNIETYFIATGLRPNSWGNGSLAYNTGAPVATILENTLGNVWFTYDSEGNYSINCDNLFNKTFIPFPMGNCNAVDGGTTFQIYNMSNSKMGIVTYDNGFTPVNDILSNSPIEIRIYN